MTKKSKAVKAWGLKLRGKLIRKVFSTRMYANSYRELMFNKYLYEVIRVLITEVPNGTK